jgi:hypothetical protein
MATRRCPRLRSPLEVGSPTPRGARRWPPPDPASARPAPTELFVGGGVADPARCASLAPPSTRPRRGQLQRSCSLEVGSPTPRGTRRWPPPTRPRRGQLQRSCSLEVGSPTPRGARRWPPPPPGLGEASSNGAVRWRWGRRPREVRVAGPPPTRPRRGQLQRSCSLEVGSPTPRGARRWPPPTRSRRGQLQRSCSLEVGSPTPRGARRWPPPTPASARPAPTELLGGAMGFSIPRVDFMRPIGFLPVLRGV